MLHIPLIQIIISCAFAGSLYGEETKQLFHGGDINTKALDNYMKLFGDNMQFCHKGESNGCMNKQEFNKLIQDKYIVNGEKISPYFDYKLINHNGNSDHGIEEIEVEFSVKHSGCTITRHETQEIHYNKNMVKKVVIKDSKDQKRVCGNNGDQRKLLMNEPVPNKVKPYGDYYEDVTTESPTKSTKVWATDMPSKAPTAPQGHIVTSTSPTMEPTTTATTTSEPTTRNPTTSVPTTVNPTTMHPSTSEPTTANPTTSNPTTSNPTTTNPTTAIPTLQPSESPTTVEPTQTPTTEPTTKNPTTSKPTTSKPTTSKPTTPQPTTANPTTSEPTKGTTTTLQPTGSPLPIPPIATPTPTKEPTPRQGFKVTTESPTSSGSTTSESPKSWEKSSWKKSSNSKRNKEGKPARRLLDASNTGYGYYVQTTTKSPTKKVWPTPSPTTTPKPSRSPSTPSPTTPSPITPSPTTANPTTGEPTTSYPTTTNPTTSVPTAPISIDCGDIISDVYPLRDVWFRFDLSFNAQSVTFSACNSDFSTILELYDSSTTQLIAFEGDGCGLIVGFMSAGVYNLKLSSDQIEIEGRYQLQIICENTPSPTLPEGLNTPSSAPTRKPISNGYWPTPKPVETGLPTTQPPSFPRIPEIVTPSPTVPVNTPRPTFPTLPPNEGIVATPSRAPTPRPVESYGYWKKSHDYWNKNYNYDDEYNGGKWYKYDNYGYDDGRGYKYGKKGGKKGKYGRKWY